MRSTHRLLVVALLLTLVACAARTGAGTGARSDVITYEELQRQGYSNLYDLIDVLRPRWLRPQGGGDTFMGAEGQVQVHMDGNWMGGVAVLRSLAPGGVTSISWLRPLDASARYGFDHSHGAIIISTRPVR